MVLFVQVLHALTKTIQEKSTHDIGKGLEKFFDAVAEMMQHPRTNVSLFCAQIVWMFSVACVHWL